MSSISSKCFCKIRVNLPPKARNAGNRTFSSPFFGGRASRRRCAYDQGPRSGPCSRRRTGKESPPWAAADPARTPLKLSSSTMLPDAPEQALDEYPMPDPMLTLDDLEKCGYRDGDMLPLSKERAMELYERDLTVYAVVDGGSAEMLFDREELALLSVDRKRK